VFPTESLRTPWGIPIKKHYVYTTIKLRLCQEINTTNKANHTKTKKEHTKTKEKLPKDNFLKYTNIMNNDFTDWLSTELRERGWTIAELARRGSISRATLSYVLNGQNPPAFKNCVAIAKGFKMQPEEVLRKAGLLPSCERTPTVNRLIEIVGQLSPEDQEEILEIALMKYRRKNP